MSKGLVEERSKSSEGEREMCSERQLPSIVLCLKTGGVGGGGGGGVQERILSLSE